MEQGKKQKVIWRILVIMCAGAVLGILAYLAPAYFFSEEKPSAPVLKMGGTANAFMIMENRWRFVYRQKMGVEIDYVSTGSTNGIEQMIDGNLVIAFTHAPLTDRQKEKARARGGEVIHIPVVLCGVVPAYNVKELKDKPPIKFTGEVLADIFMGKIERWNDPTLAKLNRGVELPATKIVVVSRADSSGSTFIFTDYLCSVSSVWHQQFGYPQSEIKWPVGVGKARSTGVAKHVELTEGAIGYVDLLHVFLAELSYGAVENRDKTAFVHAKAENMTAAAKSLSADSPEDLTFNLTNKPGLDAYPICGMICAVCYQEQSPSRQKQIADFLHWATHQGQEFAEKMSYARLPDELVRRAEQTIKSIKASR